MARVWRRHGSGQTTNHRSRPFVDMAPITPSTCEISDALIKLGSPHGGHIPDIHCLSPRSDVCIAGPAYTVQMVLASDETAPKLSAHFVDTATPNSIVVIDAPPRSVSFPRPFHESHC